jgi:hypothetical protein
MDESLPIIGPETKYSSPYINNDKSAIGQIFSSFADYLIGMKEVASLMFYVIEEHSNKLVLVEHRNMHQDFPRNFSRIEKTKYLANNVIKSNSVMELRDTDFSTVSHKRGIKIDRGFIGIPIKDKDDNLKKAKGAILLWTPFLNRFNEDRYKFIISVAGYISKSIEWNNKIEDDYNEYP